MSLNLKGKLVRILQVESGVSRAGNAWKKQDFVIETDDQYPKTVCFTLFNDKVTLLAGINPGEPLEVSFDVESREFNGKFYHNLNAWKISKASQGGVPDNFPPPLTVNDMPPEPMDDQPGDLPF
ncbi:MAG: DUF3127 domain-containing protein [Bacteroidota bacterium]